MKTPASRELFYLKENRRLNMPDFDKRRLTNGGGTLQEGADTLPYGEPGREQRVAGVSAAAGPVLIAELAKRQRPLLDDTVRRLFLEDHFDVRDSMGG
jgi:hypothetical protein